MVAIDPHEAVSAATHGVAFLAAFPAIALLVRRGRGDSGRVASLCLYGLGLAACFGASTLCHGLTFLGHGSVRFVVIDHVAIYLLIAGTYTPIAWNIMPRRSRVPTLALAWGGAVLGAVLNLTRGPLPAPIATSMYLAMGWGGLIAYSTMVPTLGHRTLRPLPVGGALYSIGAVIHVLKWPALVPGIIGSHEVFHLLVIAGAVAHYLFIFQHAATAKISAIRGPIAARILESARSRPEIPASNTSFTPSRARRA